MRGASLPIGAMRSACKNLNRNKTKTMKPQLLILLAVTMVLASCSGYQIKSAQTVDHPCYSTWNYYPHNS